MPKDARIDREKWIDLKSRNKAPNNSKDELKERVSNSVCQDEKRTRRERLNARVKAFINILKDSSVIIAAITLITTLWPQIKFWSDNKIEKANGGHVESQMFLADHYYEVGDIKESIYWYKVASANEDKNKAIALNNLAYIYVTTEFSELKNYEAKAFELFKKAAKLGEKTALINGYLVLKRLPSSTSYIENYKEELDWFIDELVNADMYTTELASYEVKFTFIRTELGEILPANTEEYIYEYVSSEIAQSPDKVGTYILYTYNVFSREPNVPEINDFIYIPISD